jgi:mRNA interferase MazF
MSFSGPYCPDSHDIVWLDFDPQAGREQAGRRLAYVLSPRKYNRISGLMLVCPITSKVKGYPFEVLLPDGLTVEGAILADHVKSLAWGPRNAEYVCCCPEVAEEVIAKIESLFPV